MKIRYNIRVKTGEKDGKAFYTTIGRVLQGDRGFSLKLDVLPMNWDGWGYLSEPKKDEEPKGKAVDMDSDIPF